MNKPVPPVDRSVDALAAFFDTLNRKGLMGKTVALSRKNAALQVLSALEPEERADLRGLDMEAAFARFANLQGHKFTAESLRTYKARFKRACEDFLRGHAVEGPAKHATRNLPPPAGLSVEAATRADVLPIPLRTGLTVQIHHLPHDLTKAEAEKIARIMRAYAVDD